MDQEPAAPVPTDANEGDSEAEGEIHNEPHGTAILLGFGEAGTAVAAGLRAGTAGRAATPLKRVLALDVAAAGSGDRAASLRNRAAQMGVELHSEPGEWMREADLVISAVVGPQAVPVARTVAPYLRPGTLYADLNTAPPETMQAVAHLLEPCGVEFVDVAVMGSFQQHGYRVPMMLAGPAAYRLAGWLGPLGFTMTVIEGVPGDASAVKMLRSVFMKGLEALCVECLAAAEQRGLRDRVLEALGDLDRQPIASTISTLIRTHLLHFTRRLEEVDWVAESLRRDGFDPIMTDAARKLFARTEQSVKRPPVEPPAIDEALEMLGRIAKRS